MEKGRSVERGKRRQGWVRSEHKIGVTGVSKSLVPQEPFRPRVELVDTEFLKGTGWSGRDGGKKCIYMKVGGVGRRWRVNNCLVG